MMPVSAGPSPGGGPAVSQGAGAGEWLGGGLRVPHHALLHGAELF